MNTEAARRAIWSWRAPLLSGSVLAVSLLALGCGNQYRPVVSAINPVGPAGQPTKYAIAISNPGPTLPGLLTFVDFAGDTVLSTPQILSNPSYLALTPVVGQATTGFVINSAGSFNEFPDGNPTALISSDIVQSTLSAGATPVSITALTLAGTPRTVFVPEPGLSQIAALSAAGSLQQNISILNNPVYVVGTDGALRAYAIGQGNGTDNGTVSSIEAGNLAVASTLTVGADPVYGVMTPDGNRAFILNAGSGTVSVINVINNGLDNNSTLGPNSTIAVGVHPVWADLIPASAELAVLNAGDGTHAGSLSIISIPLCSTAAQSGNPNCNTANPIDATGFGTVLATVPVGVNPKMVSVLQDGTKAYVANAGVDCTGIASGCTPVEGSVSVVDLISDTVTATIPAVSSGPATAGADTTPGSVYGHPATIVATTGSPTGKVYITSPDNKYLTIIETDTNTVVSHVNLQGLGVRVVITSQ